MRHLICRRRADANRENEMSETKTKLKITDAAGTLTWSDRTSGKVYGAFDVSAVATTLRDAVFAYGVKQLLSDACAGQAAGSSTWVAAFKQRAAALTAGTWGQRVARLVDADVWAAMVALGLARDSDANREAWSAMRPAERAQLRIEPRVAAYLADHAEEVADTADLMARFTD